MHAEIYPVSEQSKENSYLNDTQYQALYRQSLDDPETFWRAQAEKFISFQTPFEQVVEADFSKGIAKWFIGGKLNISYNCIDRHLAGKAEQCALIFEADEPGASQHITYQQLHDEVCQLANGLKALGVGKGDSVCIYMPMILEATYAMLACARLGAVHSVIFGGFSPEALKDRILDSNCNIVITADAGLRGGKRVALKSNVDLALQHCPNVRHCIVVNNNNAAINMHAKRDIDYRELVAVQAKSCEPVWVDAEDPLFILYTSGSTGKPKGVLHTSAGYLLMTAMSHHYIFDYRPGEIYWCTADVGWITGHSYIVYGPLANGATSLIFEGVPTYPDASRFWQIIDKHQVNIFYTAPTALRALMAAGDQHLENSKRDSLRLLGSVGEPINPEAWYWYHEKVGHSLCPIVDTWWQTETGSIMISPLPGATALKPGSATRPFFGIEPILFDEKGNELKGICSGNLAIKRSWPSQIRSIYNDHQRMIDTYFSTYKGYYFTGDGARRDADGYYWITGRVDDVLNVSGHRLGTAEVEAALTLHADVVEAAVVGFPHDIKGEAIYAYVTLQQGHDYNDTLKDALKKLVAEKIGAIARPDIIQWAPSLPKTRSGKIMRRILRKIAANELDNLGDTSTLAEPQVVDSLIANRENR